MKGLFIVMVTILFINTSFASTDFKPQAVQTNKITLGEQKIPHDCIALSDSTIGKAINFDSGKSKAKSEPKVRTI